MLGFCIEIISVKGYAMFAVYCKVPRTKDALNFMSSQYLPLWGASLLEL